MNRSPWLAVALLSLLALLSACRADSTGVDTQRYACGQDTECATGFVCLAGVCQHPVTPPSPEEKPDAGEDMGTPGDGGPGTDAGVPDAGSSGSGDGGTDGGSGPVPAKLGFVTPAQTVTAGQCAQATVEVQTAAGSPAAVASAVTVSLSAPAGSGVTLYQDSACANATPSATVAAGASRATFSFRGTTAQSVTVTAAAPGLTSAQQSETVRPAVPSTVVFISSAQTLDVGACSSKVEVELRDSYANPASFSGPITQTPSGTTGLSFYADAACNTAITDTTFAAGTTRTSFYFRSRASGTVRLTVSVPYIPPASQDQNVQALQTTVRTGYCEIGSTSNSVSCPISPALTDMAKTMLIVQAVGPALFPREGSARCWLVTRSSITCSRNNFNSNGGQIFPIWWKTVEMATGLKVQHLQPTCDNSVTTLGVTIKSVSMENAFVLVSSEIDGTELDADDFFTAKLASATRVDLQFSVPCSTAWKGSLQVVEMAGARVTRGSSSMARGSTQASPTGLSAVDLTTSALLFTHRTSASSYQAKLCDRVLRDDLASATSLAFSRGAGASGCSGSSIEEIAWERIDFGSLARTQDKLIEFPANSASPSPTPTITSVDPARTVAFSSTQSIGGQAGGESNYGYPVQTESLAGLTLPSSTSLVAQRIMNNYNGATKMNVFIVQFEP